MKHLASIVLVALLVSCGTGNKVKETAKDTIYKKWELSILDGEQVTRNLPVYIELTEDNKVSGFIGCNRLTGTYTVENGSQIKFNQLGTTRMMCPEMEMALESQVLELLNTVDNFTIDSGKLMLNIGSKAPSATFSEMSDSEIVNKYWKLTKLEGEPVQMVANQEREQYFILRSDGTISGFAGCNQFSGQYELSDKNHISINENMAMTLKACPDVEVDESAFMKVFSITDNYTIGGDTLSLSAGEKVAAVFEAVYF